MSAFRFAIRSLARAPTFTVATIATIALGLGAGCTVFGLLDAILLRPLPYPNSERLVGLWHSLPGAGIPTAKLAPGTYLAYRDAKSFDEIGVYVALAATLTYRSSDFQPERARVALTTPSTFGVLGAKAMIGRVLSDDDLAKGAPLTAVISARLWKSRFGSRPGVIGETIDIDGRSREIVGVMPESFAFPNANTPAWTPLDLSGAVYVGGFGFDGIGRLRAGVTPAAAQRELQQILMRVPERFPEVKPGVSTAMALKQTQAAPVVRLMRDDVVAGFERVLWLSAGTVALLVLVTFSNVASLLLVRVEARQREFAVRSALGATVWAVQQSLVAEMALLAVAGGLIGMAITGVALRLLVNAAPLGLPRLEEVHLDTSVALVAAALASLFVLVSWSIGVMRIRSRDTSRILRDAGRSSTSGRGAQRLRAAFVALEVAMSLVLLASSGVLIRSTLRLRAVQPGFDPTNTFTFWTFLPGPSYKRPTDVARFYREAIDRMQHLPGVISVATTAKLPLEIEGAPYRALIWADDGSNASTVLPPAFQATSTSSGYFATMRIPLLAGRSYDEENVRRGVREAVVSRGFVEHFWHDATGRAGVGKRLRADAKGPWFSIVGVVADVRDSALTDAPISEVYFPEEPSPDTSTNATQTTARDMAFVVRTRGPVPDLPALLRSELHAMDPKLPFYRAATMEELVSDARGRMTFALALLTIGAAATLVLGAVGLYGVIAYVVSFRSREISIRIALGLAPASAARLVLREGATIVVAGTIAGLVVFVVFSRLLASLAFEVSPIDIAALAAATGAVIAVAMLSTWIPARRASRADPAAALRSD